MTPARLLTLPLVLLAHAVVLQAGAGLLHPAVSMTAAPPSPALVRVTIREEPPRVALPVAPPAALPSPRPGLATPVAHPRPAEAPSAPATPVPDLPPRPVSAPDPARLADLAAERFSGLPMRLRLHIDAHGELAALDAVQIEPIDEIALPALRRMFAATRFLPARRGGQDVPGLLEIELRLDGGTEPQPDQGRLPD